MALFGTQRDVSLIRHINRDLVWDIITQQCLYYRLKTAENKVNIYGVKEEYSCTGTPVDCVKIAINKIHTLKHIKIFKFFSNFKGFFKITGVDSYNFCSIAEGKLDVYMEDLMDAQIFGRQKLKVLVLPNM